MGAPVARARLAPRTSPARARARAHLGGVRRAVGRAAPRRERRVHRLDARVLVVDVQERDAERAAAQDHRARRRVERGGLERVERAERGERVVTRVCHVHVEPHTPARGGGRHGRELLGLDAERGREACGGGASVVSVEARVERERKALGERGRW